MRGYVIMINDASFMGRTGEGSGSDRNVCLLLTVQWRHRAGPRSKHSSGLPPTASIKRRLRRLASISDALCGSRPFYSPISPGTCCSWVIFATPGNPFCDVHHLTWPFDWFEGHIPPGWSDYFLTSKLPFYAFPRDLPLSRIFALSSGCVFLSDKSIQSSGPLELMYSTRPYTNVTPALHCRCQWLGPISLTELTFHLTFIFSF